MKNLTTYIQSNNSITEKQINQSAEILTKRIKPLILDLRKKDKGTDGTQGFFKGHKPVDAFLNTGSR